eukprot:7590411-Lingulodinium_polyedra.AAC.1
MAPASRAKDFREGLAFCAHFMGLEGAGAIVSSARVQGAVASCYARKRFLKKAPPLRVSMVECLERVAAGAVPLWDKVVAGFAVFCVGARLRVGDAARIRSEPTLELHLENETPIH